MLMFGKTKRNYVFIKLNKELYFLFLTHILSNCYFMLHKIRGIVLRTTDYQESSVVVQLFTDKFGIQSYLINGVKKPKAKIRKNMLQPLHLVEMVAYHKNNNNLQRVSELKPQPAFVSIPYDIYKSTMAIFLNEVLYKSIKQQGADEALFDFIFHCLIWLDHTQTPVHNFHLSFMLKLSRFLGFAPAKAMHVGEVYFDLQEGVFCDRLPAHPYVLKADAAEALAQLFQKPIEASHEVPLSNALRRQLLDDLILFFKLHTASFGDIQSHKILETILS